MGFRKCHTPRANCHCRIGTLSRDTQPTIHACIPDWQLPPGVDRGLWDYLHAGEMVAGYDEQMRGVAAGRGGRGVLRAGSSRRRAGWSISAAAPGDCACTSPRRATSASASICRRRCSRGRRTTAVASQSMLDIAFDSSREPRPISGFSTANLRLRGVPVQHARDGPRARRTE